MQNGIYLDELFIDSNIATIVASGGKEYLESTLSMKNNAVSMQALKTYSKDNFAHCRCIIDDKFIYAYNGEILKILY